MAARKAVRKDQSDAGTATSDLVEQKVVALAEQVGWFLGTVQAKAEGWLDREALRREVGRIRDGAADLLEHVNRASAEARRAAKPAAAAAPPMRASRGATDAPGKRHRKPPTQERLDKRMGEPVGKKMGQKNMKNRMRSGRG